MSTPNEQNVPTPSTPQPNRRTLLKYSALAASVPAGAALLQPLLRPGTAMAADSTAAGSTYAPVPPTARGPRIPSKGYLVQEIRDRLFWITDGTYQMMFLVTGEGVVVVDAPPTLGHNILRAIAEVTDEPITHVVYSHHHADHIGAAGIYPTTAVRIAHEQTRHLLREVRDPNRPQPTRVVSDSYRLEVGDQVLQLRYKGPNHSPDNLFIYAPEQRVLMLVDVVFPGWVPFKNLAMSDDIPGWIKAHEQALDFPFETYIGGHLNRLGNRRDVEIQREYMSDLDRSTRQAIAAVDPTPMFGTYPDNPWAVFKTYLDAVSQAATDSMVPAWKDRLGGADVFTFDNAFAMFESLRIDYGVLGPFGIRP
ncbi:MBL fold metallo-hydrolase [Streptomyces sp. NPDC006314]|uniref:MBL fold metallo-hydrolase n=1 Tax=Streptomyces sp. NPDC006314 TaxID=3154475 RepID=UPI0033BB1ACF